MSGLSPPIPAIIEAMSIPPGPPIPPIPPIPPMPPIPPPRPPMFFIISSRSPPPAAPPSPSASLSSSSFHLPKSTFKASHVLHHLLKITSASSSTLALCIAVILILPLAEVHLQPVLLGLLSQEPLPVGSLLSLFQSKLNAPRSHLVLGRLRVHLLQKLHVKLESCFFSAPSALED